MPITTDFAVMKERNQGVVVKGDIAKKQVQKEFKKQLIALLKDEGRKEEIRSELDVKKFTWDNVAQRWNEEFTKEKPEKESVSIIIPTYNRPEMLLQAVESALSQTYQNKEVIVVDDGSDKPPELPEGVKLISLEHSGKPSVVRNAGIKEAKSDWHFFLDDDDMF